MKAYIGLIVAIVCCIQASCSSENRTEATAAESMRCVDNSEWIPLKEKSKMGHYVNTGELVFYTDRNLQEAERIIPGDNAMLHADPTTFMVSNMSEYAKDNDLVYFPIEEEDVESAVGGYVFAKRYIVEGANPRTFKYLGDGYAVDNGTMYKDGLAVNWDSRVIKKYANYKK